MYFGYGHVYVLPGQSAFAVTTTTQQFTAFNGSNLIGGDTSIIPSATLFGLQLLVQASYMIGFSISGMAGGTQSINIGARINGVLTQGCQIQFTPGSSGYASGSCSTFLSLTKAQVSTVVNDSRHALIDVGIFASGSVNFTPAFGNLWAIRVE